MGNVRIACQAITWGDGIGEKLTEILPAMAAAGYEGAEIGFRHIQSVPAERTRGLLVENGLELAASHVGGNLEDIGQAQREQGMIDSVLDYLEKTETRYLMYSGLRYENDEQLAADIEMIGRAARQCAERGVQLLYHNHNWEFEANHRVMNRLLEQAPQELGLCPDVGWVAKAGVDVISWLDSVADRIGAVHFKDFATLETGMDPAILGTGAAPLTDVAAWVRRSLNDIWVVAEQDSADIPAADAAKQNAEFLTSVFR